MKLPRILNLIAGLSLLASAADASDLQFDVAHERVPDTQLAVANLTGKPVKPLAAGEGPGTVLIFVLQDCPVSNAYSPEYRRIHDDYTRQGFQVHLVYTDEDATVKIIQKHQHDYKLEGIPTIHDKRHVLAKLLGASVTPEAAVVRPDGVIAYRGRIDNLYEDFGEKRRRPTVTDLRNALDSVKAKKPVVVARTKAVGCFIPPLDDE